MHPAPSLAESFPKSSKKEERSQHVYENHQQPRLVHTTTQLGPPEPLKIENHSDYSVSQSSPPMRKDTGSSTSTNASSDTAVVTTSSTDTSATAYSVESSQSIFSVKDGAEISSNRRASRRRTGPLSAAQREKAALIRKLGACPDCRRRRVACHPNHHNMSWEEAVQKYRSSSPLQDLANLAGRPLSPAPRQMRPPPPPYARRSHEMDIDAVPVTPIPRPNTGRVSPNESRINRTPLPSGPRIERHLSMPNALGTPPSLYSPMPHPGSVKHDLESTASKILAHRGRYTNAYALLIFWQDEQESSIEAAVEELAEVFQKCYHYTPEIVKIPSATRDGYHNPWRWLSRIINEFIDKNDTRDTLKVVYYSGFSYLDDNREMVLSSSRNREKAGTIRWNGIQHILEEANSDTLILMDSMYYPATKIVRQNGVLELIAASAPDDYYNLLERGIFTRALSEQLRARTLQRHPNALSAAELHAKLMPIFPKLVLDRYPEKGLSNMSFPAPLHMQASGNARLPSITLSPLPLQLQKPHVGVDHTHAVSQLTLSIRLTEELPSLENWAEWFRMMPDGVQDVKVEGPYSFR
ncbi:hypothetical protein GGS20DRAFT_73107 [Poronia punctata]|nr:hypothetical protein GGS20DRAFT_73107 [Poronia punctata]